MDERKVVLVTGCSSGFGYLTAQTLARRGHTVFAGIRDPEGKNAGPTSELRRLAEVEELPLYVVALDVTSDTAAERAVDEVITRAGRIDVLVNNAGIACFGISEAFTIEQVAEQFDTNVFGALRMNRAVLPHMRAAGRGLLLQISTDIGRVPMPFMGVYCATKAASEMFAEEARYELAPLGIDSAILQGAYYPTPMVRRMVPPADGGRLEGYGSVMPYIGQIGKAIEWLGSGPNPPDAQEVADAVATLVEAAPGTRPLRTLVGAIHPEGMRELNEQSDRVVQSFYAMMGVSDLLELRSS